MRIELIMTGEELMDGRVINKNATDIANHLLTLGFEVQRMVTVGDEPEQLTSVFEEVSKRADAAIITGGLGPTDDDRTGWVLAKLAGVELECYPEALELIQSYFQRVGRPMSKSNEKQAYLPKGATMLRNDHGTAPGFQMQVNQCHFFALPGVPREMQKMLEQKVSPALLELSDATHVKPLIKSYKTFGLAESQTQDLLKDLYPLPEGVDIGYRAKFPEIHVRIRVRNSDPAQAEKHLQETSDFIEKTIGKHIFTDKDEDFVDALIELMHKEKLTLAAAESCTGGLVGHLITQKAGVSSFFLMSAVTYSNEAKTNILGVPAELIEAHGAVSEEVARSMAEGARKVGQSDVSVAITGIAGPGGGSEEKPVGTVHIATAVEGYTHHRKIVFPASRDRIQRLSACVALDMVRRQVLRKKDNSTKS